MSYDGFRETDPKLENFASYVPQIAVIPWVLVSTFKYLWTHKYSRTREFLTHGSESPGGWNPHRSRYGILNLKYPWVWIWVTHECTRALPYITLVLWYDYKVVAAGLAKLKWLHHLIMKLKGLLWIVLDLVIYLWLRIYNLDLLVHEHMWMWMLVSDTNLYFVQLMGACLFWLDMPQGRCSH